MTNTAATATKKKRQTKAQLLEEIDRLKAEVLRLQNDVEFGKMLVSDLSKENADVTLHQTLGHLLDTLEPFLRGLLPNHFDAQARTLYYGLLDQIKLARAVVGDVSPEQLGGGVVRYHN